jgi:hypothetical protein
MAWTVSKEATALGNKRVVLASVTSDSSEANLDLGLAYISHYTLGIASCSTGTALPHVAINKNSSGTAANGILGISGVTSGDALFLTVYGR